MPRKPSVPARPFKLGDLKQKCRTMQDVVQANALATDEELRDYRPGGANNRDRGKWGWINWHMHLGRFNARTETRASSGSGAGDPEAQILKALRREPVLIEPVFRNVEGMPRVLAVHPKGLDALLYFHAKNVFLGGLSAAFQTREAAPTPEWLAGQRGDLLAEITYQQRLLVWCATDPSPWLPFDPHTTPAPELPSWTLSLDAHDLLRVIRAHHAVDGGRLRALKSLITSPADEDNGSPFAWSVFGSMVAQEMGVPASVVLRDYTLEELLAQTALAANAKREAMDRAKQAAEDGE